MLSQILQPAARERSMLPAQLLQTLCRELAGLAEPRGVFTVARIALVKPDKAQAVENLVIQLAQRGQLSERVRFLQMWRTTKCLHKQLLATSDSKGGLVCNDQLGSAPGSPCLQVSEDRLIGILEQVNQQSGATKPRVTIQRRRAWDDD